MIIYSISTIIRCLTQAASLRYWHRQPGVWITQHRWSKHSVFRTNIENQVPKKRYTPIWNIGFRPLSQLKMLSLLNAHFNFEFHDLAGIEFRVTRARSGCLPTQSPYLPYAVAVETVSQCIAIGWHNNYYTGILWGWIVAMATKHSFP